MLTSMNDIRARAMTLPRQTVAVACAHDTEALKAVAGAHALGLAHFVLVGDTNKIHALADDMELDLGEFELVEALGEAGGAAATVRIVASGQANILLKGFVDSSVLFKAVLDRETGLRNGSTVSHTVVMDVPGFDKLYLLTDAAMIIKPDLETKRQIVLNAITVSRALGNSNPVVGVLCESEKVNPKMAATMDAAALVAMNQDGRLPGCRVGGPYALDNAISVQAAEHKGMTDPLAGRADILLAPDLAAGNIFYKSLMYFARAKSAGVTLGTTAPVLLNSRADSHETKINAVALGILMAAARNGDNS
ncbi:MAG: bifunctional enoyl-CoA hydratase/phosphate acetyltransferase [Deltaproteobacteria bacterium]|nr:bifunctional enoyl-CoA hydratase/phosphate acetyltransferase [Deltaproteobacteria bacterium]